MKTLRLSLLAVVLLSACAAPAATKLATEVVHDSIITVYRPPT